MPNGTVLKIWHLKCYERVHILTGHHKPLKEYTKLISKELVNFKCLKTNKDRISVFFIKLGIKMCYIFAKSSGYVYDQ